MEGTELRVGEDPSCDVFLDPRQDPGVCGRRATIQLKDDGWYARSTGQFPVLLNHATLIDERRIRSGDVLRMSETGPDLLITIEAPATRRPAATEPRHNVLPEPAETVQQPAADHVSATGPRLIARAPARITRRRWLVPVASSLAAIGLLAAALLFLSLWPGRTNKAPSQTQSRPEFSVASPQVVEEGDIRIEVTDDGQPPVSRNTVVQPNVRGDPWQRVASELRDSLWLVEIEAEGPKGTYCWPFATGCAIDRRTLLLSAREVLQIAGWRQQGRRIWAQCPAKKLRFNVTECRVHREFAALAGTRGDWIYANLGLLLMDGQLPQTVPLASAAQQQQIEEGLPIGCYAFLHDGGKITRFDRFEPQLCRGEVYLISPFAVLPDRLKLLEIQAAIPENAYGSPILTQQGMLIGVYGDRGPAGVKDLHYATLLDRPAIESWIQGRQDDWVAPPPMPPAADAQRTPTKQDALP